MAAAGDAGDVVAVEVEEQSEGSELFAGETGAKGDIIHISTDGANTLSAASGAWRCRLRQGRACLGLE